MTVVLNEDRAAWWVPEQLTCFRCGAPADPPAVLWAGEQTIVLHPGCAQALGAHLIKDSREAALAGGGSPMESRAVRAAAHAIGVREAHRW